MTNQELKERYEKAAVRRAAARADLVVAERAAEKAREAFDQATRAENEALRALTGDDKVYRSVRG